MMNLNNITFTESRIREMAYIGMCLVMHEVMAAGMRIAMSNEIKAYKKQPFDSERDGQLLRAVDDPHVKLASALADYLRMEVLFPYACLNALDTREVLKTERQDELAAGFAWRFMFYRENFRHEDRYADLRKVMLHSKQLVYELMLLMVTGQTGAFNRHYPIRFSNRRLRAMTLNNEDRNILMLARLVDKLIVYERKCREIKVKS